MSDLVLNFAALPRSRGRELRVDVEEHQEETFVSLRIWERGKPTGVRLAVRSREVSMLVEAVRRAEDYARQANEEA